MNGIEKITARIESDMRAEADAILSEANEKVSALRASYEQIARENTQKAAEAAEKAARQQVERMESSAQMEAKTKVLATKQQMIDKAFEKALADLLTLGDKDRTELLARLAAEGSTSGKEEILLTEKDRALIGEQVVQRANLLKKGAALTLSAETREMAGGVVLKEGNVEVNCSYETRLRLLRETMAGEVAKILFP